MNSRSLYSFIFISCTFISSALAQANLLNARVPQNVGQLNEKQNAANDETPLAYGFIDDRDVLWSKTVWEIIDLNERINFPFYYPTDTISLGSDRRSLFDVLKKNIGKGTIKEIYSDDYFQEKITYQDILDKLVAIDTTDLGKDQLNAGEAVDAQFIEEKRLTAGDIRQYKIKGTWYVNKRQGELKYRLLGIAPCSPDVNFKDDQNVKDLVELFWVWFPDARQALNSSYVFNVRNSSQPITFDHMLNSRRFNSIIYKEENVYQDRKIEEYIYEDALKQLLESERIKSVIRDFEQDLWNN